MGIYDDDEYEIDSRLEMFDVLAEMPFDLIKENRPTSHEATSAEEQCSSPSLRQSRLPNSHPNRPHP